ncbi:MAG: DUF4384 domain-containing protein [Spirochaetales bacterium]|jgi:hypothetical protein|nr:DUF4384 domain-containing protein [Spirochaetales bacterium]
MKKIHAGVLLICAIFALMPGCATQSQSAAGTAAQPAETEAGLLSLDEAVRDFSIYLTGRVPASSAAAVLNVEAPLKGISDYVTDTLEENLLNTTQAKMVSRQNLELIKKEQHIQGGAYVDKDTAVRMGHIAGWETVISGAVSALSAGYRMSLWAVAVESAELLGAKNYLIKSDAVLAGIVNPSQSIRELARREEILRPFTEQTNDFDLRVSPAGAKDVFYDGEDLRLSLLAGADCYFVVYQVDVNNMIQLIYPKSWDKDNTLKAGVKKTIPEHARFDLHSPFGEERILVYASEAPIDISPRQYEPRLLTPEYISNPQALWQGGGIAAAGNKGLSVRPRGAAGQFVYTILPD